MRRLRTGARWHLRVALASILLFDLVLLAVTAATDAPGPRTRHDAPALLLALTGHAELVLPLAALGAAALVRFALAPGRAGAALGVLAVLGLLTEARAANHGGPERFLFAGGTALIGWIAGLAFVRAGRGDEEAEEVGAEAGALAAIAAMYVNAGVQKLLVSGTGWADGDSLRMLVLTQRPLGPSLTGPIADAVVGSRALAFSLAAFTEIAQLSAIAYPFLPRARPIVGSMLLAFHAGVFVLTPIAFPQAMALLVAFSYPWQRLLARGAEPREMVLARAPARGASAIGAAAALLAGLALLPPVQEALEPLSHRHDTRHAARVGPPREAPRPTFDARAAAALGIDGPGARVAGCEARAVTSSGDDVTVSLACPDGVLVVEIVPDGSRPHSAPRSTEDHDLFYRSGSTVTEARRDALLEELAGRSEQMAP